MDQADEIELQKYLQSWPEGCPQSWLEGCPQSRLKYMKPLEDPQDTEAALTATIFDANSGIYDTALYNSSGNLLGTERKIRTKTFTFSVSLTSHNKIQKIERIPNGNGEGVGGYQVLSGRKAVRSCLVTQLKSQPNAHLMDDQNLCDAYLKRVMANEKKKDKQKLELQARAKKISQEQLAQRKQVERVPIQPAGGTGARQKKSAVLPDGVVHKGMI